MPKRLPNVLFITADQLRKDALGCYGNPVIQTPNIDALAERGVRFERMFTAYPVCAPNRASIVTGRYPSIHRLRSNGMRFPKSELTLMQVLRGAGYGAYGAGKMHFGPQWEFPRDGSSIMDPDPAMAIDPQPGEDEFPWYGFDHVSLTEDHRMGPYGRYLAAHGYDVWEELHSASYPQHATERSAFPEEHHQTTWITRRAIETLRGHPADLPFFLWVSYVHPHHPFNPPAPYDAMYDPRDMPLPLWEESEVESWPEAYRRKYFATEGGHEAVGMCDLTEEDWRRIKAYYYGMVSQIDRNIGWLIDAVKERGWLEDTVIVFTADHGENLGDHRLLFKGTTYDCVTNMPFVVSWPGDTRARVCDSLASSIDIMPTMVELAGLNAPSPSPMQGRSLVPALTDKEYCMRDALLIENVGVRRSVRTSDALLTWHGRGQRGELYDLVRDPGCLVNLWDKPEAAKRQTDLLHLLVQLMAENVDPLPVQEGPW